jgi:hypothetical protein
MISNDLRSFFLDTSCGLTVSELYPGQSSKNIKKGSNSKISKAELGFLFNALLLTEIYLPTKFLVMSRTRKCGQTDRQSGDYMLFLREAFKGIFC